MTAPVCHIAPVTPENPGPTPNPLPSIPVATADLNSLMRTANALRQAVMQLTGQLTQNRPGEITQGFQSNSKPSRPTWSERSRKVEKVKVYQNNDKSSSNWVEIEQINQLVMADRNTGQTWTWDRNRR